MYFILRFAPAVLLAVSILFWTDGLYIHAKARLAQYLIAQSWSSNQNKPWPWADTWPVARLRFDRHDTYVLAGAHGSALAFGPGHVDGTALPGSEGTSLVAGHRDTHFAFLAEMANGDVLEVQSSDKRWLGYEIVSIEIVDTRQSDRMAIDNALNQLVLVTCFPFDAIEAGGPLRFVVTARFVPEEMGPDLTGSDPGWVNE